MITEQISVWESDMFFEWEFFNGNSGLRDITFGTLRKQKNSLTL